MLAGLDAFNGSFLADLNAIQSQITQLNQQISSGVRVSVASDDPGAVAPIINDQTSLDELTQAQTNLQTGDTEATAADNALQTASTLMNQLVSIATEGSGSTSNASNNAALAEQVQSIQQEMVNLANTAVQGRYIFGGDSPTIQPYTYNAGNPNDYVDNNPTVTNTEMLSNGSGGSIAPRMTAASIFDNAASGSILQNIYSLSQGLATNNQAQIQSALTSLQGGVSQINQATTFYGNVEKWIQQSQQQDTADQNTETQALSNVKDTDVAAAATQLTTDQTAIEAALSAHGSLSVKSLFSYLG